ncbi:MAG TPA: two-component regulator propeller domain-containing protein, partial [Flavisolibacter sp.]|nr:two-component regulator propeller domain-containing protein [Flavisolibacter sp.]
LFNPDAQLFHNYSLTTPKRYAVEGKAQVALQLPNREIWIGYRDLGLFRYNADMHPLPLPASIVPLQEEKSVWDLHLHSKNGQIWIGLQGGKLIVYDTLSKQSQLLSPAAFEQRAVKQIAEDKAGNLWFGTQGGNLVKWSQKTGKPSSDEGFSLVRKTGVIERLFIDRDGYLWVAAIGEGLLKINTVNGQVVAQFNDSRPPGQRLWNNNPKDIISYNDSLLVVAAGALHLLNRYTHQVRFISSLDGLPTNTVQSIAKDSWGRLWLGTMNGLCVADINKLAFTVYDQSDGLLNDHFNIAGAFALQDGQLLFTSAESILIFNPSLAQRKNSAGTVFITDIKLMNQSLSVDSLLRLNQISLSHNNNNLAIEFS